MYLSVLNNKHGRIILLYTSNKHDHMINSNRIGKYGYILKIHRTVETPVCCFEPPLDIMHIIVC